MSQQLWIQLSGHAMFHRKNLPLNIRLMYPQTWYTANISRVAEINLSGRYHPSDYSIQAKGYDASNP